MGVLSLISSLIGTSCSKKTVHVEFINAKDKSVVAVADMSPERLPDSFAIDTTFTLKDQKWSVESADPIEKNKFVQTGKLRVVLSPITMAPPDDILFSLATISDDISGPRGNALPSERIFALHEDDWRQVEFVSQSFDPEVEQELLDIRNIYKNERDGIGFKKVHLRKRIPNPFKNQPISLPAIEAIFQPKERFEAVGFFRARGTIPQSFAWKLDSNLVLWGLTDNNGNIMCLCISGLPEGENIASFAKLIASFNSQNKVMFVDWCRATKITSDLQAFGAYFQKK